MLDESRSFRALSQGKGLASKEWGKFLDETFGLPGKIIRKAAYAAIWGLMIANGKILIALIVFAFSANPFVGLVVASALIAIFVGSAVLFWRVAIINDIKKHMRAMSLKNIAERIINHSYNYKQLREEVRKINPGDPKCITKEEQRKLNALLKEKSDSLGIDLKSLLKMDEKEKKQIIEKGELFLSMFNKIFEEDTELKAVLTEQMKNEVTDIVEGLSYKGDGSDDARVSEESVVFEDVGTPAEELDYIEDALVHRLHGRDDYPLPKGEDRDIFIKELITAAKFYFNQTLFCKHALRQEANTIIAFDPESGGDKILRLGEKFSHILSESYQGSRCKAYCQLFFGKQIAPKEEHYFMIYNILNVASAGGLDKLIDPTTKKMGRVEVMKILDMYDKDIDLGTSISIVRQMLTILEGIKLPRLLGENHEIAAGEVVHSDQKPADVSKTDRSRSPRNIYEHEDDDGETLHQ